MLDVNIVNLRNDINDLKRMIEEYEEIQLNIFNQLKESCANWKDGYSIDFENKIYLEKQENQQIISFLKEHKNVYEMIYNKYNEFGNRIKINLEKKTSIISKIDSCQIEANGIINNFREIDSSFFYSEYNIIMEQRKKVINVKSQLSELKSSVINLYSKVEKIEQEIRQKINKLEYIKINSFDFNLN